MGSKELFRISSKYQGAQEIWVWGIRQKSEAQSIGRVTPDCVPAQVYVDPATKTLRQLPAIDIRYVETLFLLGVPGVQQSPGWYCPLLLGCAERVKTLLLSCPQPFQCCSRPRNLLSYVKIHTSFAIQQMIA